MVTQQKILPDNAFGEAETEEKKLRDKHAEDLARTAQIMLREAFYRGFRAGVNSVEYEEKEPLDGKGVGKNFGKGDAVNQGKSYTDAEILVAVFVYEAAHSYMSANSKPLHEDAKITMKHALASVLGRTIKGMDFVFRTIEEGACIGPTSNKIERQVPHAKQILEELGMEFD